ncbi:MAG: transporter [Phycisphaerales bacterium]|nr:MAG: transporter [Phycisphaerales bacterium]
MSRAFGKSRCTPTMIALLLLVAAIGRANTAVPELVTDRPDQTESSETVRPGFIQFEFGWTHSEDDEGLDATSDSLPETLIRLGVTNDLELRFGFDGYVWEDTDGVGTDEGAGDTEIGVKWKLWEETGRRPQAAILAGTSLPTGQARISSERFDPSIRLACSHTLTETMSLGYNLVGLWTTEEDERGDRDTTAFLAYSIVLGIALSEQVGTFVEFFGDAPTHSGKPANSFDAGLTYLLANNLQLDLLGGVGLSEAADDWFIGAGVAWRLPR